MQSRRWITPVSEDMWSGSFPHTLAPLGVLKTPADLLTHRSFILQTARLGARAATSMDVLDVGQELVSKMRSVQGT